MTAAVEAARTTARILLEIEAVHFRPQQPFILTSGRASPVYIDCRKIIAFPRARAKIIDLAVATIEREIGFESLDAIAGGETAGIPFAAWIADRLGLPMLYVRKKPKGFGRGAQIEGQVKDALVVFHYGIFPSVETLAKLGVRLHGLATWRDMLAVAEATGLLNAADARDVRAFLDDPEGWSTAHGGKVVA